MSGPDIWNSEQGPSVSLLLQVVLSMRKKKTKLFYSSCLIKNKDSVFLSGERCKGFSHLSLTRYWACGISDEVPGSSLQRCTFGVMRRRSRKKSFMNPWYPPERNITLHWKTKTRDPWEKVVFKDVFLLRWLYMAMAMLSSSQEMKRKSENFNLFSKEYSTATALSAKTYSGIWGRTQRPRPWRKIGLLYL